MSAELRRDVDATLLGANERLKDSLERMALAHQDHFSEYLIEMMRFEIGRRAAITTDEIRLRLDEGRAQLTQSQP